MHLPNLKLLAQNGFKSTDLVKKTLEIVIHAPSVLLIESYGKRHFTHNMDSTIKLEP